MSRAPALSGDGGTHSFGRHTDLVARHSASPTQAVQSGLLCVKSRDKILSLLN